MKSAYLFRYTVFVSLLLFVSGCGQKMSHSARNAADGASVLPDTDTLSPLQQYRKLIKEKKYADALPVVDAAISEKAKTRVKEFPQMDEGSRLLETGHCYLEIYVLLNRDEEALNKYEEYVSQLSEEQRDKYRFQIFITRLFLFSRMNRIEDIITECNSLLRRHLPHSEDYLLGYLYGALGYALKKDDEKAKQYFSLGRPYFEAVPAENEDVLFSIIKKHIKLLDSFFAYFQDEYELKLEKKPPVIEEENDGMISITLGFSFVVVSKKTGALLESDKADEIIRRCREEEQKRNNNSPDDPFLLQHFRNGN